MTADDERDVVLSLVIPAHDEEATIDAVVRDSVAVVRRLAPGAGEVIVVDDGSTDRTGELLDALAAELDEVAVVHQRPNRGHGPALLVGFDRARGRWIGHLDSDDQIPAGELESLWPAREAAALVLGTRTDRDDPRHRLVVTVVVRAIVSALARRYVRDANVPCKLVERSLWTTARPLLPDDTFAPSIALVVVAARRGVAIEQVPVHHRARAHGASSLRPVKLARALALATRQTIAVSWRARPGSARRR
ncbi:MAG: glycosyltransferase family 2 protein [Acidimicrobiales bacterium]|nr:glycosyltransferase family 2 protein [Acidimicrobiales bacterium]HRW36409.1 glycosyltransferase family 2 protein [Aquihabitans sp.]